MQFAKDSVYVAFRDRLAIINPARTIQLDGISRPAVLVSENQALSLQSEISLPRNAFELQWGSIDTVVEARAPVRPLMKLDLLISYNVEGTDATSNDRGRALGTMDSELLQMCTPRRTPKQDYTQASPVPLGSMVFWSDPQLNAPEDNAGLMVRPRDWPSFIFPKWRLHEHRSPTRSYDADFPARSSLLRSRRPHDWHARCVRSREVWQLRFGDSSFTLD